MTETGQVVGFAPTVNEINYLSAYWDEVVHIACLEKKPAKGNSIPYTTETIRFVPIPSFGGPTVREKMNIITQSVCILRVIHAALRGATEVQLRLPMGIGVYVLPYFIFNRNRSYTFWVKYANNWMGKPASIGYAFQRWILKKNLANCKVTINGRWEGQPAHCHSFENPCLQDIHREEGAQIRLRKHATDGPFTLIFVGRVEHAKGIDLLLEKIADWPVELIRQVHIIGDGPLLVSFREALEKKGITVSAHGYLTQEATFEWLKASDFLLLPSRSEGFPKVVAEALNFGCLPIVTAVGSVAQYIREGENGFLVRDLTADGFNRVFQQALRSSSEHRRAMTTNGFDLAGAFTFRAYVDKLKKYILNDIH
jgi:glycosyltransferase involved in cell wall biosynthesis